MKNPAGIIASQNGNVVSFKCKISPLYPMFDWLGIDYFSHRGWLAIKLSGPELSEVVSLSASIMNCFLIFDEQFEAEDMAHDFASLLIDDNVIYFPNVPYLSPEVWSDILAGEE